MISPADLPKRPAWTALVVLGVLGLIAGLVWWGLADAQKASRRAEQARKLVEAREHVRNRKAAEAEPILRELVSAKADPEAALLLAEVERDAGRAREAVALLEPLIAISETEPELAGQAAILGAEIATRELGQFTRAEAWLEPVARRCPVPALRRLASQNLATLYLYEGRIDDARGMLASVAESAAEPSEVLVQLWRIDSDPFPVDKLRALLERAAELEPTDERVKLGLARLAEREGKIEDAITFLREADPVDPVVARATLELAMASERVGEVAEILMSASALEVDPVNAYRLKGLLARFAGQADEERAALATLLELDPGASRAIEELVGLEAKRGESGRVAELRKQKAALDAARERYRALLSDGGQPVEYEELADLADRLGRYAESAGWWRLVARSNPANAVAAGRRSEALKLLARRKPLALQPLVAPLLAMTVDRAEADAARPEPKFVDRAEESGLRFVFDQGLSAERQLPETMAGGVGLLDYNGDGHLDVYAIQGGRFPPAPGQAGGDRLFRNRGDGRFEDVTESAGIDRLVKGYGHGVAVGDVDGDGDADLFLTRWRAYQLLRNRGDGTFEDATEALGLGGDRDWPTSAAFADLDGDADLDLYVCHYLTWDETNPILCRRDGTSDPQYCEPRAFPALPDHLFRNDGDRFVDVSDEAGITAHDIDGRGLGVVAADLDEDGKVDLYVANDTTANFLWRNLGGMRFEEVGLASGVAAGGDGGFQAGMGVACGDVDGDGRLDLAVTNFYDEGTTFYQNLGGGLFADRSSALGLTLATKLMLGFGLVFLDADGDGRLDIAQANGHVNDYRPNVPYAMPAQLLLNGSRGRLRQASSQPGSSLDVPRLGRGLAVGDLNGDARDDLVLVGLGEPMAILRNEGTTPRTLRIRLEGTRSNRDAVGTRVIVKKPDGSISVHPRLGGGSYQSANAPELSVGLGEFEKADIEVHWLSGHVDQHFDLNRGATYRVREGDWAAQRLR